MTVYSQLPAWAAMATAPRPWARAASMCSSPRMITFRRIPAGRQEQFQTLPGEAHKMAEDPPGQALPPLGAELPP